MTGLEAQLQLVRGRLSLDLALSVAPDEVVALVGPNGAGKTTALRALAGLERLEHGRVTLGGDVLEDAAARVRVPPERRSIGVVFQDHLLFPHLSVLENVAFGLRSRGRGRAEARRVAAGWLERMGLADRAARRPHELSGGLAQRVALARALAGEPRLLLLDEPLSALDATARAEVRSHLRRHLGSFTGMRLLVTHDPLEALSTADRLVVMENGAVVQTGSPAAVRVRPRSRYVADLVGVNLFEGRAEGDRVTLPGGFHLVVPAAGRGPVFAVVHPRAVALHVRRPEGTPRNVWPAKVEELAPAGERVRVRLGGAVPIVAEVTPSAVADLAVVAGSDLWISVKASEISVYPV